MFKKLSFLTKRIGSAGDSAERKFRVHVLKVFMSTFPRPLLKEIVVAHLKVCVAKDCATCGSFKNRLFEIKRKQHRECAVTMLSLGIE